MGSRESTAALEPERRCWQGEHRLCIDNELRDKHRALVEGLQGPMKLCRQQTSIYGLSCFHYYLTDGASCLEFGDAGLKDRCFRIRPACAKAGHLVEREFEVTEEVRQRLRNVSGSTNFSLALRNSEHMARYIQSGTWCSLEMSGGTTLFEAVHRMLGDKASYVNTPPEELQANPAAPAAVEPLFPELRTDFAVTFTEKRRAVAPRRDDMNVVILGPTGAGKSSIINLLFNAKVAKVKHSPMSVTRQMDIYSGFYTEAATKRRLRLNVVDSVGFCDSVMTPDEVLKLAKGFIKANMLYLDKVVIVCARRVEHEQADAIKNFLKWLKYDSRKKEFVFIYNQAEDLDEVERLEAVVDMCSLLGADPRYSVLVPVPGSKDRKVVKFAFATGFPPKAPLEEVQQDVQTLYDAILRRRTDRARLVVQASDCFIL